MIPVSSLSTHKQRAQTLKTAILSSSGRLTLNKPTSDIFVQYNIKHIYVFYQQKDDARLIWLSDTNLSEQWDIEPYQLQFGSGAQIHIKRLLNLLGLESWYYIGNYTAEQYFSDEEDNSKTKSSVIVKLTKVKGVLGGDEIAT